ncbi:hypothetical protein GYMLUDRAFT_80796 [Collybiopsis luxurians FD-317 M1]|nr:hypothetical protein GYMLUDRAFT_80796 [Collybiopsis luxurians FD-317 M1]
MAHQSPMMAIPRKSTDEVDWTTPIRKLIAQSYGESPDNYAAECAALQRCRQDAVRGAGSDTTARDLLYKYFGQLELLELRFSEIRVTFPWRDAFTNKLTTQTSIAFEKASILFQIASVHSALASSQSRSDPEGLKRAFYYFKSCAGMLSYINDNFLHAPSTDLSREVIKFLVAVILAQATEIFFEKCTEEKKGAALVSKVGSQAASMYTALAEQVKEFMGKGIFDRNWVTLIQVKAKYFTSLTNYYRAQADNAAGKHGEALVRYNIAETNAKEASRLASTFNSAFNPTLSPTFPPDAGSSLVERLKAHLSLCTDRKTEAQRENDLIYNAILPNADSLPVVEQLSVAVPIPIQEVYGTPEVQKTIGQDIFLRLIPLSVHESASVYSEEKAKLARGEVERAEKAESEARAALDGMGVKEGLAKFRAMAEGEADGEDEIPLQVHRWKEDISLIESREPVTTLLGQLSSRKAAVKKELENISAQLETESHQCEMMRVKYQERWTQDPSAGFTRGMREELKSHMGTLEAAAKSDVQVIQLWEAVKGDIGLLINGNDELEEVFRRAASSSGGPGGTQESLLDLVDGADGDAEREERARIGEMVAEIEERLGRMNKISRERGEILKDLKEKIQTDDVSHLLLLNRRNSSVEPALFASELEKFRPFQQRIGTTVHHQEACLQEIAGLWKRLTSASKGRGGFFRKWEEREKRKKETVERFERVREGYMEVRDGLAKGLNFYSELTSLTDTLKQSVGDYVKKRTDERDTLVKQFEVEKRLSALSPASPVSGTKGASGAAPPLPPPPPSSANGLGLSSSMASMNLGSSSSPAVNQRQQSYPPPPPSQPPSHSHSNPYSYSSLSSGPVSGLPPPQRHHQSQSSYLPPPPPSVSQSSQSYQPHFYGSAGAGTAYSSPSPPAMMSPPPDPYASLGIFGVDSAPSATKSPPLPPPSSQYHQYSYAAPSAPSAPSAPQPPSQQPAYQQNYQQPQPGYGGFPPPPPSAPPGQGGYGGYGSPASSRTTQQQQYQGTSPPPPQQYQGFPPPPQQNYGGYYGR